MSATYRERVKWAESKQSGGGVVTYLVWKFPDTRSPELLDNPIILPRTIHVCESWRPRSTGENATKLVYQREFCQMPGLLSIQFDKIMKVLEMDRLLAVLVVLIGIHMQALVPRSAKSARCIVLGCGLRRSERHRPPCSEIRNAGLLRSGGRGTGSRLIGTSDSFQRIFVT